MAFRAASLALFGWASSAAFLLTASPAALAAGEVLCNPRGEVAVAPPPPSRKVILIQGVSSTGDADKRGEFGPLIDELRGTSIRPESILVFSYNGTYSAPAGQVRTGNVATYGADVPTSQHPGTTMRHLTDLILRELERDPTADFDLIGYSLGGFTAAYLAASLSASATSDVGNPLADHLLDRVHAIITVSSPLGGDFRFDTDERLHDLIGRVYFRDAATWLKPTAAEVQLVTRNAPLGLMTTIRSTDDLIVPTGMATLVRPAAHVVAKRDCQTTSETPADSCGNYWEPPLAWQDGLGFLAGGVPGALLSAELRWLECAKQTHGILDQPEVVAEIVRAIGAPRVAPSTSQTTARPAELPPVRAARPGSGPATVNIPTIPQPPVSVPAPVVAPAPLAGASAPLVPITCKALPNPFDPRSLCPATATALVVAGAVALVAGAVAVGLAFGGPLVVGTILGKMAIGAVASVAVCQAEHMILGRPGLTPDALQCAGIGAATGLALGGASAILSRPAGVAPALLARLEPVSKALHVIDKVAAPVASIASAVTRRLSGMAPVPAVVAGVKAAAAPVAAAAKSAAKAVTTTVSKAVTTVQKTVTAVTKTVAKVADAAKPIVQKIVDAPRKAIEQILPKKLPFRR